VRTWDENKTAINQLWPAAQFTDEERKLWHDDLASLDQAVLYDAIRNAKRTHESVWPQIKWVLDAYHELNNARRRASKQVVSKMEKLQLDIDDTEDSRYARDFVSLIDQSAPSDFSAIEAHVLDTLPKMHSSSAVRVLCYARFRLLGYETRMGRVTKDGDIEPIGIGGMT